MFLGHTTQKQVKNNMFCQVNLPKFASLSFRIILNSLNGLTKAQIVPRCASVIKKYVKYRDPTYLRAKTRHVYGAIRKPKEANENQNM